jgi:membrane-bound serine protease (ClpP class)
VALLVAETFLPTFGVVGVGGLVAFVLGSLFLFDASGEDVQVARSLVVGAGGGLAVFILVIGAVLARSRRAPARLGVEGMIGAVGHGARSPGAEGTVSCTANTGPRRPTNPSSRVRPSRSRASTGCGCAYDRARSR